MHVNSNRVSYQQVNNNNNKINSHKNQSNMTQAIDTIKNLSSKLPKIENNSKITTKTVVTKDLKALSKLIGSVIKDTKIFLDKANDSNASRRPDNKESITMQENLGDLKKQITAYKNNAFSISSYTHNPKKEPQLNNLTKQVEKMEKEVISSNKTNNILRNRADDEKMERNQQANERQIKRIDIKNQR
ncbi:MULTISPECIES: hypothetical protein [Providencia]|uniref:hypothetical protein n=1 Tax=Providencia TaxID=586 RepID=UPI00197D0C38|nr:MULTISPECIES: hypothetical protein [Providencia]MBN4866190.1 hypothetical protein [Providencia stuartii]MBN4875617.1 hypothetical protein [Providencia stuartii]MBN4880309.1 hypothetical protein [Providencia stuartii]MBN4884817.1 hypothetical protein [Providencia stuartii]